MGGCSCKIIITCSPFQTNRTRRVESGNIEREVLGQSRGSLSASSDNSDSSIGEESCHSITGPYAISEPFDRTLLAPPPSRQPSMEMSTI